MKKQIHRFTLLSIFIMVFGCFNALNAQGLLGRGETHDANEQASGLYGNRSGEDIPDLPTAHGSSEDAAAPLGNELALLIGLGTAYWLMRKQKNK